MDTAADQCSCGGPGWVVLDMTGENVTCNGYLKENTSTIGTILPIVSAVTCVTAPNEEPFLLVVHQATYYDNPEQNESLCLPFQAKQHGVKFSLAPSHRECARGNLGTQNIIIEDKEIPLLYDGRKMYLNIRKPSKNELYELESFELTSPEVFIPDSGEEHHNIAQRRNQVKKKYKKYPGGLTMLEWRKRLAYAPEDVVRKTFEATTQMAMHVEAENRMAGRRHYRSRFPFMREKRINDIFYSDTFSPTVRSKNGDTCSQIFLGRVTDFMSVYTIKKESHSF